MCPSDRRLSRRIGIAAAGVAAILAFWCLCARACGPFFPNTILRSGDQRLLECPVGDFREELDRLLMRERPRDANRTAGRFGPGPYDDSKRTAGVDLADLAAALKVERRSEEKAQKVLAEYAQAREVIRRYVLARDQWRWSVSDPERGEAPRMGKVRIPEDLPVGFGKYLEGAALYHQGKLAEARAAWQGVLDTASPHRAVWAAYMIARSYVDADANQAVALFPRVRELAAKKGFEDSQDLARESVGWEARANLNLGRYDRAVELYLQQEEAGVPGAVESLRDTAEHAFASDGKALIALASSEKVRPVLAAYLLSHGVRSPVYTGEANANVAARWLEAVEKAGVAKAREADRLAWAAYQVGDANAAQRWADRAPADAAIANWVRAKLLLRQGRLEAAAEKLALAVPGLPRTPRPDPNLAGEGNGGWWDWPEYPEEGWKAESAAGELAVLKLARSQYVDALDVLLRYDWWEDAAHVAERVLSVAELRAYVDKNWPARARPRRPGGGEQGGAIDDSPPTRIRHLLARRLAREGQLAAARPYLPEELRPHLKGYEESLAVAKDAKRPDAERANAYIKAARLARYKGMELLATETAPDWHFHGGTYEEGDIGERTDPNWRADSEDDKALLAPATADERKRAVASIVEPNVRFHYRYVAAELMWQAAALMPDGNERTAYVLCEGGTWLKNRDPNAADRFYKALVKRCGGTTLGKEADKIRWFPRLPMAGDAATQPGGAAGRKEDP